MTGEVATIIVLTLWCGSLTAGLFWQQHVIDQMKMDINHNFKIVEMRISRLLSDRYDTDTDQFQKQLENIFKIDKRIL